ncbi:MAG: DUF1343 domain-containing protein, partial [Desulfobacterales bacterium]|nr:DUF1343 domain-containing protein [Desulfobacterales bacterium]
FHHKGEFEWKQPPYEYEYKRLPIDLIIGDKEIRRCIEKNDDIDEIARCWQNDLNEFIEISKSYHLYHNEFSNFC